MVTPPPPGQLSPDGKWYWDGIQWAASMSPDGRFRWNGTEWLPFRRMRFGEYVDQSIVLLVMGIAGTFLCPWLLTVAFYGLGLGAALMGLRHTPNRRTQALIGIVANTVGLVILVLLFVANAARRA
jgi:small-conductance mechanosensitive channel